MRKQQEMHRNNRNAIDFNSIFRTQVTFVVRCWLSLSENALFQRIIAPNQKRPWCKENLERMEKMRSKRNRWPISIRLLCPEFQSSRFFFSRI